MNKEKMRLHTSWFSLFGFWIAISNFYETRYQNEHIDINGVEVRGVSRRYLNYRNRYLLSSRL